MVKAVYKQFPWPAGTWFAIVVHEGPPNAYDPTVYHCVFPYTLIDIPPGSAGGFALDSEALATACAKDMAMMPMVARDLCIQCRGMAPGPFWPRWNIYRAPNGEQVPLTFYWDITTGPPPGAP